MTKADLIETLATEQEMSRKQAGEIVDMFLEEIKTALQKGDKVALTPFGSFVVRQRRKREGRNPKTGETITIAARKVPAFQAGKALRDAVSGNRGASGRSRKGGRKR
ncbi:MAG: HU family DNA-binding protein [Candidatus Eremiobacteraeota bacterium]|nr:HU family DNA-binding protein [Candidatus Eremiobacteraeota bacterium]